MAAVVLDDEEPDKKTGRWYRQQNSQSITLSRGDADSDEQPKKRRRGRYQLEKASLPIRSMGLELARQPLAHRMDVGRICVSRVIDGFAIAGIMPRRGKALFIGLFTS